MAALQRRFALPAAVLAVPLALLVPDLIWGSNRFSFWPEVLVVSAVLVAAVAIARTRQAGGRMQP